MENKTDQTFVSDVSNKEFPVSDKISGASIRPSVLKLIQNDYPDFDKTKYLSMEEVKPYRDMHISNLLADEIETSFERYDKIIDSINNGRVITCDINEQYEKETTVGERLADKVASFGGSWPFILIFIIIIMVWMMINVYWLSNEGFDPYPFILLNLFLSCLAALQAPIIMMSQNRQGDKDRLRARDDFMINLKSELELRTLHEKVDHLMLHQQQQLMELQKLQLDLLNDIADKIRIVRKPDDYESYEKII